MQKTFLHAKAYTLPAITTSYGLGCSTATYSCNSKNAIMFGWLKLIAADMGKILNRSYEVKKI